jgi:hypothetical protein
MIRTDLIGAGLGCLRWNWSSSRSPGAPEILTRYATLLLGDFLAQRPVGLSATICRRWIHCHGGSESNSNTLVEDPASIRTLGS